jgi:aminotransferase
MRERTITISGGSKTYSITGWRIGWLIAPPQLTAGIRKVHDFLTVGAAHPLQIAVAAALHFPPAFYDALLEEYRERRDVIVRGLREVGFVPNPPAGAYYVMAGIDRLTELDDVAFAHWLVEAVGVATVPGSSFYANLELGRRQIRFSFPKRLATIERGLAALREIGWSPR